MNENFNLPRLTVKLVCVALVVPVLLGIPSQLYTLPSTLMYPDQPTICKLYDIVSVLIRCISKWNDTYLTSPKLLPNIIERGS